MAKKNNAPAAAGVKLDAIYLQRVQLDRIGPWPGGQEELDLAIKWGIGAVQLIDGRLGVELAVLINHEEMLSLEIVYRLELAATGAIPEKPGVEAFWRNTAGRVAPIVAVPYIRELVHSLTGRAFTEPVMLPIANYGDYFKPEEIPLSIEPGVPAAAEIPH